ncbi:DUF559 domain-containing protein [Erythrobacter mangrovi]|uniref:DUF559 domain-containing protein n=1 Tax=Erythrobacter mangrovi TaxID=2739433 RepID=A0A7D3XDY9_9SPHN|nr:DUF559 domain-containing protein [Erythrobacter mangrovi]
MESYLPEALLWRELRARPSGLKFTRQRATGKYVHAFYCRDARLAIEIEDATVDAEREEWLGRAGIATMTLSRRSVIDGSRHAAQQVIARAMDLLPRDHPALSRLAMTNPRGSQS